MVHRVIWPDIIGYSCLSIIYDAFDWTGRAAIAIMNELPVRGVRKSNEVKLDSSLNQSRPIAIPRFGMLSNKIQVFFLHTALLKPELNVVT